ncbi:Rho GTPase-activating protein 1 [Bulinus truncatus]|nr:Rho GTPase-activating protein 1 [Bulinus truncatus]
MRARWYSHHTEGNGNGKNKPGSSRQIKKTISRDDKNSDDLYGRKVIVISACKLPSNKGLDHGRLLQYIKHTLDKYVEQDYVLVYFHHGLNRSNKPKLSWLLQAYREFDRKYKKNLKMLYLVHPTNFIKVLWNIFRPFISAKFGQKMMYVNYLNELKQHLPFEQLLIPPPVLEYIPNGTQIFIEALDRLWLSHFKQDVFVSSHSYPLIIDP